MGACLSAEPTNQSTAAARTKTAQAAAPGAGAGLGDVHVSVPGGRAPVVNESVAKLQNKKFFKKVREVDTNRDYSILIDTSGSMGGERWAQAKAALEHLVPAVTECDADGITVYFFNMQYEKCENIKSAAHVMDMFSKRSPGGGTYLAQVLDDAVKPDGVDSSGARRPETVLVISDGEPSDQKAVERVIINATKQYMKKDSDLSITFIQVGEDETAARWLAELDDGLEAAGAAFDCVDTIGFKDLQGTSFAELIRLSLAD